MKDLSAIAAFPVMLLDMNSTFMFEEDRFGPAFDYAATYASLGGTLPGERVSAIIEATYAYLDARYMNPAYRESFPALRQALEEQHESRGLNGRELDTIEETFAAHERGVVPGAFARALAQLAAQHRLGLVADIWSPKARWLEELDKVGALGLFETLVFSSDHGWVKPSPRPFRLAMEQMKASPPDCIYVGDSVRRDIGGARAAGIQAVWIGEGPLPPGASWRVDSLLDLLSFPAVSPLR